MSGMSLLLHYPSCQWLSSLIRTVRSGLLEKDSEVLFPSELLLLSVQLMLWFVVLSVYRVEVDSGVESVLLPCKTRVHLPQDVVVAWKNRKMFEDLCVYQKISDQPEEQDDLYRDRTEFKRSLRTGNLSLTLKNPTAFDTGIYICTVYSREGQTLMEKQVFLQVKGQCCR